MAGGIHPHGVNGSAIAFEPSRRRIEREHLAFVEKNRHRMSWQAMAAACGVNQTDLRQACERAAYAPPPLTEGAPAKPAPSGRPPSVDPLKALRAIASGAICAADVAEACHCTVRHARELVSELKRQGLLAGHGSSVSGWVLTAAGRGAVSPGRVTKPMRVLRLIADGLTDAGDLADRLQISRHQLSVYLSGLRRDRMIAGGAWSADPLTVTPDGLAALKLVEGGDA
jgi:hypothetical protein